MMAVCLVPIIVLSNVSISKAVTVGAVVSVCACAVFIPKMRGGGGGDTYRYQQRGGKHELGDYFVHGIGSLSVNEVGFGLPGCGWVTRAGHCI